MGTDTVRSSITYTLSTNLEKLTLTDTSNINATGNASVNVLIGNSGNNTLDGGSNADSMSGGDGNDTYTVDNAGDVVTELSGKGTDKVQTGLSYILGNNVENLTLTGTAAVNGTGNGLDNVMAGNTGANVLTGGAGIDDIYGDAGADTINGGAGADILAGGGGNDTFVFSSITDSGTTVLADRDLIWDCRPADRGGVCRDGRRHGRPRSAVRRCASHRRWRRPRLVRRVGRTGEARRCQHHDHPG